MIFVGVLNKTIIPLALVGYEKIIANSAPRVVIEMGILSHTSNISKINSKIPDYAREYRNGYLFIRK